MPELKSPLSDQRMRAIAFFGALCLFFSTLEYLIPKPTIPFFRLGLANLPILLAFPLFSGRDIVLLTLLKVLGQGLVNGTLVSYVFLFSLSGSVVSAICMYAGWKLFGKRISFLGLSLIGALASNTVQIALSLWFIFGTTAWVIAPTFMGLGLLAGFFVGVAATVFEKSSSWYADLRDSLPDLRLPVPRVQENSDFLENGSSDSELAGAVRPRVRNISHERPQTFDGPAAKPRRRRKRLSANWDILGKNVSPLVLFWAGLIVLPAYFFTGNLFVRLAEVLGLLLLALLAGRRLQFGYFLSVVLSIAIFNLFAPAGKVLLSMGPVVITQEALFEGLDKGLGIVGLVFLSLATVRSNLRLPGKIGALLGGQFLFYEAVLSRRGRVSRQRLIDSVDDILRESSLADPESMLRGQNRRTSVFGWFFIAGFVLLPWIALFFIKNT